MTTIAPTFKELADLTAQDLRDRYDAAVGDAGMSWQANFYLDELRRRESRRNERRMLVLTIAIAFLTAVNVYAVFSDDHSHGNHVRYEFGHHARRSLAQSITRGGIPAVGK